MEPTAGRSRASAIHPTVARSVSASLAPEAAEYKYSVTYKQGSFEKTASGTFRAVEAHKRGILRVDSNYPWHFIWEGTGEHYFFNGTTAYWLLGWRDDHVIQYGVDAAIASRSTVCASPSPAARR